MLSDLASLAENSSYDKARRAVVVCGGMIIFIKEILAPSKFIEIPAIGVSMVKDELVKYLSFDLIFLLINFIAKIVQLQKFPNSRHDAFSVVVEILLVVFPVVIFALYVSFAL